MVDGLADFNKDSLQQLGDKCMMSWRLCTQPQPWGSTSSNNSHSTLHVWSKISKETLMDLVKSYEMIGQPLMAANMQ